MCAETNRHTLQAGRSKGHYLKHKLYVDVYWIKLRDTIYSMTKWTFWDFFPVYLHKHLRKKRATENNMITESRQARIAVTLVYGWHLDTCCVSIGQKQTRDKTCVYHLYLSIISSQCECLSVDTTRTISVREINIYLPIFRLGFFASRFYSRADVTQQKQKM